MRDNLDEIEEMITNRKVRMRWKNDYHQTGILYAVANNKISILELLLREGGDPSIPDDVLIDQD